MPETTPRPLVCVRCEASLTPETAVALGDDDHPAGANPDWLCRDRVACSVRGWTRGLPADHWLGRLAAAMPFLVDLEAEMREWMNSLSEYDEDTERAQTAYWHAAVVLETCYARLREGRETALALAAKSQEGSNNA